MNIRKCEQPVVAIDIESTGLRHDYHEITEIGMILLDEQFNIIPNHYYSSLLTIKYPERYEKSTQELTGISLDDLYYFGKDPFDVRNEIINWITKVSNTSSIIPLGQFYDGFDRLFLKDFFNMDCNQYEDVFSNYFSRRSIDLYHSAKTYNNLIDIFYKDKLNEKFERLSLNDICKKLNVDYKNKHRALDDAKVTAIAYKKLMLEFYNLPNNFV